MDIDSAWFDQIAVRRSRRRYDGRDVAPSAIERLARVAREFSPFDDVAAFVIPAPDDEVFSGILGPLGGYGRIRGAPHILVFSAPEGSDLHVGYVGEALVLEATALDLGTCWVAGTFDASVVAPLVDLDPKHRVHAISPVGRPVERARGSERTLKRILSARARKPLSEIAPGLDDGWPLWARAAVEAARLAPSGANRQPWRFSLSEGSLVLSVAEEKTYWTRGYDCGCALLHARLGALRHKVRLEADIAWSPGTESGPAARLSPL